MEKTKRSPKPLPDRMCIACRQFSGKDKLIRIVKNKEGKIFVDGTFKASGRGAYLCKSSECLKKCIRTRMLNKAFKCAVNGDVYLSLEAQFFEQG
jgi:predicted RNA-binding protein YlxR (DUF448 family)